MDRTHAITRLNTEEIATEVNNVIKKGLDKLLGDYLYRYELLEQTHDAIMNLPSVRNHLNLAPFTPQQYNPETNVDNQILEKLLKRIDELTFEVNQLKQTCKKEYIDIKVEDELVVVKLEQKENIRLEIEEASASEDDASEAEEEEEEEEEEEDASASEADDESSVAEEEEEAAEETICSECDCKVILDEDIVVVDGKKFCGACDPTSSKEEEASETEEEEEEEVEEEVVKSSSANEIVAAEEPVASLEDDVETEKSESVASEAEEEAEEEEEEFIEIDIDDITYCTNNEENGFIYELTEDGDVGEKVGYLKDGEPFFYADEK